MPGMTRAGGSLTRVASVVALALVLQGAMCRASFSSGREDEDDRKDELRTEAILMPPLRDPWGRPLSSPIPVVLRHP